MKNKPSDSGLSPEQRKLMLRYALFGIILLPVQYIFYRYFLASGAMEKHPTPFAALVVAVPVSAFLTFAALHIGKSITGIFK